jgi:hypothetical protein
MGSAKHEISGTPKPQGSLPAVVAGFAVALALLGAVDGAELARCAGVSTCRMRYNINVRLLLNSLRATSTRSTC